MKFLHLYEDVLPAHALPVYLPAGPRALYLREGSAAFSFDDYSQSIEEGGGITGAGEMTIHAGDRETRLWRWELTDPSIPDNDVCLRSAPSATSALKLKMELALDSRFSWLMRLDRVSFPAGGVAWTHLHQGPGIRICRNGSITIDTEGESREYGPDEAWAEKGTAPVFAPTTREDPTTFIRCFLLPKHNKGTSSIRIVLPEDRRKENTQKYHVFSERIVTTV